MKYLLDVNVLIALSVLQHEFHTRTTDWVRSLRSAERPELLTCSITELGFVRVVGYVSQYGLTLSQAKALLLRTKAESPVKFSFVADGQDVSHLPAWVKAARQVTDGHLMELAKGHDALLATMDKKIPNAFVLP